MADMFGDYQQLKQAILKRGKDLHMRMQMAMEEQRLRSLYGQDRRAPPPEPFVGPPQDWKGPATHPSIAPGNPPLIGRQPLLPGHLSR